MPRNSELIATLIARAECGKTYTRQGMRLCSVAPLCSSPGSCRRGRRGYRSKRTSRVCTAEVDAHAVTVTQENICPKVGMMWPSSWCQSTQKAQYRHGTTRAELQHPIFWLSEQAKVETPLCTRYCPLVRVMLGGGTRKFLGMCSSPSYSIMPAKFTCGFTPHPLDATFDHTHGHMSHTP